MTQDREDAANEGEKNGEAYGSADGPTQPGDDAGDKGAAQRGRGTSIHVGKICF